MLKATPHEIAVVARGEQLRAIASDGLSLQTPQEEFVVHPHTVTDTPADLPGQDVVFVTLKAHSQPAAARDIASLLAPKGTAVFANNGIPWWWPYRGPEHPGEALPLLDPQGALWTEVRPERALGCVVYSANEVVRPWAGCATAPTTGGCWGSRMPAARSACWRSPASCARPA